MPPSPPRKRGVARLIGVTVTATLLAIALPNAAASASLMRPDPPRIGGFRKFRRDSAAINVSSASIASCLMTQLNVLGVTLDVQLDTSSSDLEVPNAGINDYSSAHVSVSRPPDAQEFSGAVYDDGT
nr:hypothetical protein HK105_008092 [Polyrhizophydium stewartii]